MRVAESSLLEHGPCTAAPAQGSRAAPGGFQLRTFRELGLPWVLSADQGMLGDMVAKAPPNTRHLSQGSPLTPQGPVMACGAEDGLGPPHQPVRSTVLRRRRWRCSSCCPPSGTRRAGGREVTTRGAAATLRRCLACTTCRPWRPGRSHIREALGPSAPLLTECSQAPEAAAATLDGDELTV